jgi:hypothetical protein
MDLHVHTCLSPCADNSMVPRAIVERAKHVGLDAVGICDHNAAANVQAVREAGREAGIGVLAGIEVATAEEIHLLALFESEERLQQFAGLVKNHLSGSNNPELFGDSSRPSWIWTELSCPAIADRKSITSFAACPLCVLPTHTFPKRSGAPSRRFSLKRLRLPRSEWPWRQETDGELSRLGPGIPDR